MENNRFKSGTIFDYSNPDFEYSNVRNVENLASYLSNKKMMDYFSDYLNKRPSTWHEAIDNLIAKADRLKEKVKSKDDFRFGQFGNIKTNLIESLFKNRDLLNVGISGQMGKNKQLHYGLDANKHNFGFNLSKRF